MQTTRLLFSTPLLGMTAFGSTMGASTVLARPGLGEERLLGLQVKADAIEFKVETGGCTKKSHFGLETLKLSPLTVRLVRIRPDFCEAQLPGGTSIQFSYAEIGAGPVLDQQHMAKVVVVNPVQASENR